MEPCVPCALTLVLGLFNSSTNGYYSTEKGELSHEMFVYSWSSLKKMEAIQAIIPKSVDKKKNSGLLLLIVVVVDDYVDLNTYHGVYLIYSFIHFIKRLEKLSFQASESRIKSLQKDPKFFAIKESIKSSINAYSTSVWEIFSVWVLHVYHVV